MSPVTKELLERVESWPIEDQEELADLAREIESRRTGIYRLSDEERAAVRAGMDDARRGHFATFRRRREPGISKFRVWSFEPSRNDSD